MTAWGREPEHGVQAWVWGSTREATGTLGSPVGRKDQLLGQTNAEALETPPPRWAKKRQLQGLAHRKCTAGH